jgi:hypothetical protein
MLTLAPAIYNSKPDAYPLGHCLPRIDNLAQGGSCHPGMSVRGVPSNVFHPLVAPGRVCGEVERTISLRTGIVTITAFKVHRSRS